MLKSYPTKPCRYCKSTGHFPYQCWNNPKKKDPPKYQDKTDKQWQLTRKVWFKNNKPTLEPFAHYECYLCRKWLKPPKISGFYSIDTSLTEYPTLDHILPRSRNPKLRYSQENLRPCCWNCNMDKGSKVL